MLRRASERGKDLLPTLETALMIQAGLIPLQRISDDPIAFAANQRDEVRDLHDVAGALGAQPGMNSRPSFLPPSAQEPGPAREASVTPRKAPRRSKAPMGATWCRRFSA